MDHQIKEKSRPHDSLEERRNRLFRKNKADQLGMPQEILLYLAGRLDIENVEAALLRVVAYSSLMNRDVDIELVEEALSDQTVSIRVSRKKSPQTGKLSRARMVMLLSGVLLLNGCTSSQPAAAPVAAEEKQKESSTKEEQVEQKEQKDRMEPPVNQGLQDEITLPGVVHPFQVVTVSPSVAGNVKAMEVDMGAYVQKDQVLAHIDESDLALQIKQAESQVRAVEVSAQMQAVEQQIRLNDIKATLAQGESLGVVASPQSISEAEAALIEAKKNLEKSTFIFNHGGISQEELEQVKLQVQQAEKQLQAVKETAALQAQQAKKDQQTAIEVAKLQKQSIEASAKLTKMNKEQALADLELIRYQYNNLTVKAPIAGFISDKKVMIGDSVSPSTPMFVITNLDKLFIEVNVPEALINRIKVGQPATVLIPTIEKNVEGKVTYVAPVGDPKYHDFPIKVLVDNADHQIRGGMRAQVKIGPEVSEKK